MYLFVPMLDVGAATEQQLHQVLVSAGAGQRERRVVVGVRLAVHVHGAVGGGRGRGRRRRAVRLARAAAATRTREATLHTLTNNLRNVHNSKIGSADVNTARLKRDWA